MKSIHLYCTQIRQEEKALLLGAKKRGLPIEYHLVKDGFKQLDEPAVAMIRTLSHSESLSISNILELTGSVAVNSAKAIRYCADKALAAYLVSSIKEVPQPKFSIVFSPTQLKDEISKVGLPFVIKPLSSSWGRGICLVRDEYCMENWLAGRESLDAAHKNFPIMMQEYIEKPGYDLRVVVAGNEPIVAFKRQSEHWITNTHLGATVERIEMSSSLRQLVSSLINVLGAGFFGIDLFETKDGRYLFNEINHNPDFIYSSSIHGVDVADHYLEYIADVYKQYH